MKAIIPCTLTLLALLDFTAAQTNTAPITNCTVFNWDQQPGYLTYSAKDIETVSGAITCPSNQNRTKSCPLTADGVINVLLKSNLTGNLTDTLWQDEQGHQVTFLYSLVYNTIKGSLAAGQQFNDSIVGTVAATLPLEPGTSGYLKFTVLKRCFAGTMSGCSGGYLEDGVGVEFCAGVYTMRDNAHRPILDGEYTIQNVSAGDVTQHRDPFEFLAKPEDVNGNWAGRKFMVSWELMSVGLLTAFVAVLL